MLYSFLEQVSAKYAVIAEPTLTLWHGGNLEFSSESISHRGGRWEHGPGLYLTTHYDTAKKYAKGSRKLYQVVVREGKDLSDVNLPIDAVHAFIDEYFIRARKRDLLARIEKHVVNNKINAETFLNITINENGIRNTDTDRLRNFLVQQGADYLVVDNPFGWGERMLVLFNMKNMVSKKRITPKDTIEVFDLPKEFA
jgi:hypothetical protein